MHAITVVPSAPSRRGALVVREHARGLRSEESEHEQRVKACSGGVLAGELPARTETEHALALHEDRSVSRVARRLDDHPNPEIESERILLALRRLLRPEFDPHLLSVGRCLLAVEPFGEEIPERIDGIECIGHFLRGGPSRVPDCPSASL